MTVSIHEARTAREMRAFIEYPLSLYRNDSFYAPQLTRDLKTHFSTKNPFFRHASARYFLAYRSGEIVGRVASIVNRLHNDYHRDRTGFFGFYESIDDPAAAGALLGSVEEDLRARGMDTVRGPMNFSTNEELGFLVEGFDEPSILMTPYNKRYYDALMAACGYGKVRDLYAFLHDVRDALPEKILRAAAIAEKRGITAHQLKKSEFPAAMRAFKDIFNSAWSDNWGFVPMTDEEIEDSVRLLQPIIKPEVMALAFHSGEPVGFIGMVPDYNVVLRQMRGRLTPITVMKALYYSRKITDLRMLLLGVKKEYRNKGVDGILFREAFKGVKSGGYKRVEFSWILEENLSTIRLAEMIGSRRWKVFRIYERRMPEAGSGEFRHSHNNPTA
ncbi:MAG TPA: GNAT family N-acetyltransferase [Dissulfurispiraceae bacterium]|nr:GNAT family N-acetyltransferase [Dissulfurispiraceae bacterium]